MPSDTIWYAEAPEDEFDYASDWETLVDANSEPGGGIATTVGSQDAILVGYIPFNKIRSAERFFLGFSYADDGDPFRLYREPPFVHPLKPNLRCHGFNASGQFLASNPDNPEVVVPPEEIGGLDTILPGGQPFAVSPFQGPQGEEMRYATYQKALVTLRFKSFGRMRFLLDDETTDYRDEIKRYVRSYTESASQTLSVDGLAQCKFAESSTDPAVTPNPLGITFPAPLAALLARSQIKITWHFVPHNYVSSSSNFLQADQLIARLGTWNTDTFLGNLPGTLLFNAFQAEEVLFPVLSNEPLTTALTGWNLTLCFEQFDPPKGVPGSQYRGHRLGPYRVDGKWYWINREKGDDFLPGTDFAGITKHWNAP